MAIILFLAAMAAVLAEAAFGDEPSPAPVRCPQTPACRPAPNSLMLVIDGAKWIVIDGDGHVHFHGPVKLDAASLAFWDSVAKNVPWRPSGCGKGK